MDDDRKPYRDRDITILLLPLIEPLPLPSPQTVSFSLPPESSDVVSLAGPVSPTRSNKIKPSAFFFLVVALVAAYIASLPRTAQGDQLDCTS